MGKTVVSFDNRFEWDEEKDFINKIKHGYYFAEVVSVFDNPCFIELYDGKHSALGELRYIGIGFMHDALIVVCYTDRGERIRIISARSAAKNEEVLFYERIQQCIRERN